MVALTDVTSPKTSAQSALQATAGTIKKGIRVECDEILHFNRSFHRSLAAMRKPKTVSSAFEKTDDVFLKLQSTSAAALS